MTEEIVYLWLCHLSDFYGDVGYIGPLGLSEGGEVEFEATPTEADAEGQRRADLWEGRTGGWINQVTLERRGPAPSVRAETA